MVFSDAQFLPFATNHRFISFMLYTIGMWQRQRKEPLLNGIYLGFVGFVASLKRQYLKYQFGLFGWVHMSLLVLVVSRWGVTVLVLTLRDNDAYFACIATSSLTTFLRYNYILTGRRHG